MPNAFPIGNAKHLLEADDDILGTRITLLTCRFQYFCLLSLTWTKHTVICLNGSTIYWSMLKAGKRIYFICSTSIAHHPKIDLTIHERGKIVLQNLFIGCRFKSKLSKGKYGHDKAVFLSNIIFKQPLQIKEIVSNKFSITKLSQ